MKKVLLAFATIFSLGLFCSCSSGDEANNLEGDMSNTNATNSVSLYNSWVLVSYGNELNEVLKETKGYYYIITFNPDGTYSGKAYGNQMGGNFECKDSQINISHPEMTKVQWEGADEDKFFLEILSKVNNYIIIDRELRLYYSKDKYFKFRINNDLL